MIGPAIVANTGPLLALSILDRLDILKGLFSRIIVPREVEQEIARGGVAARGIESFKKNLTGFEIMELHGHPDPLLVTVLDRGEGAVIQCALENNIGMVVIDERKARNVATSVYGLKVIGTARILVEAKRKGFVPKIEPLITQLLNGGYWIHKDIVDRMLHEAGEG
ncbi:MAG: hypothetical protein A2268_11875 [Candidatus Raymondbacteria bacterium RifOxyA12_full_50_37]|uniref:DUF3368 domain-containing protein n=1 Tax=Candidatus Raymondbacteria bacterium RIFOXYD12_FULL_49_13 TaxID=1817890 RepID=A0A1F7FK05_UNCRA|nr:MAG: hypothetical protein A2268_11875 [Candidatus Raymondbacteria bacterium RifOxyA12_full_50_37]OGJ91723.1 MAG: hypothetical protein A2248_13780 [Candidatus Raymondbacteria bacterium RIFOXYA2_FULL_49_16]OGK03930.1 MAG: hypothetical protein A2350_15030 [Candidatus Raymondbacteria bacterium RifOxyB12_full_50_8]OGK06973.1 MAG: hypothetical protein A2519_17365 [Candidatus Raymondbacteria bacterium RIFOXYD12_FULL_49_13]OGP43914.1 MAG: hypothetical protein A2324_00385 [Candidatus Raymondbacteria 